MHAPSDHLSPATCQAARILLKLSEEELAEIAQVSASTIRRYESGKGKMSAYAESQILDALKREGILFVGASSEPTLK